MEGYKFHPITMAKNPTRKLYVQSILAFIIGSQSVHYYLQPLKGYQDLVEEKKSQLWQNYLKDKSEKS